MRVDAQNVDLVWACCQRLSGVVPYWMPTDAALWRISFWGDVDGEGDTLFSHLQAYAEVETGGLVGFVQVGITGFGLTNDGKDYDKRSGIIRMLWYAKGRADIGQRLIREAEAYCGRHGVTLGYAFFHYFGMSCYARHGKLHESLFYMEDALGACGFEMQHENVYYSLRLSEDMCPGPPVIVHARGEMTAGGEQPYTFLCEGERVGECVLHFLPQGGIAYLRWFGVDGRFRHLGMGSRCMRALLGVLCAAGIARLDTDTIDSNAVAQRFYQRMGFVRMGVTRSYFVPPRENEGD